MKKKNKSKNGNKNKNKNKKKRNKLPIKNGKKSEISKKMFLGLEEGNSLEDVLRKEDSILLFYNSLDYFKLVDFLLEKYGEVPGDYFIESANGNFYKNKEITRASEDLAVHHIMEYYFADLSKEDFAKEKELQGKEALVYANPIEHFFLHYFISEENNENRDEENPSLLGIGGIVNHGLFEKIKPFLSADETYFLNKKIENLKAYKFLAREEVKEKIKKEQEEISRQIREEAERRKLEIKKYKIGISEISKEELINLIGESKHFNQYDNFYIAKNTNGVHLFFSISKKGEIVAWCGLTRKKLPYDMKLENILDHMTTMFDYYEKYDQSLNKILKPLSEMVSKSYPNNPSAGRIHGAIIDIDQYSHIKIDLNSKEIIPYEASDKRSRMVFGKVEDILKIDEKVLESEEILKISSIFSGITKINDSTYKKFLLESKNEEREKNTIYEFVDREPGFYNFNNEILQIQKTISEKRFYTWSEEIWNFVRKKEDIDFLRLE